MARIALTVVWDVDERKGDVGEFAEQIAWCVVGKDGTLRTDFGPNADGGYEGPVITEATLLELEVW